MLRWNLSSEQWSPVCIKVYQTIQAYKIQYGEHKFVHVKNRTWDMDTESESQGRPYYFTNSSNIGMPGVWFHVGGHWWPRTSQSWCEVV